MKKKFWIPCDCGNKIDLFDIFTVTEESAAATNAKLKIQDGLMDLLTESCWMCQSNKTSICKDCEESNFFKYEYKKGNNMHDIRTTEFQIYRYFIIYDNWGMAIHKFCKDKTELDDYIKWIASQDSKYYSILQLGELDNWYIPEGSK